MNKRNIIIIIGMLSFIVIVGGISYSYFVYMCIVKALERYRQNSQKVVVHDVGDKTGHSGEQVMFPALMELKLVER